MVIHVYDKTFVNFESWRIIVTILKRLLPRCAPRKDNLSMYVTLKLV